jgi:hypothetical protein
MTNDGLILDGVDADMEAATSSTPQPSRRRGGNGKATGFGN